MAHIPSAHRTPQAIAIDENNAAENPQVIDTRAAMTLGKEGAEAHHLRLGQPEQVAHQSGLLRSLNHARVTKSMGLEPSITVAISVAYARALLRLDGLFSRLTRR